MWCQGDADIFFPTDFHFLRKMDIHCSTILNQGRADTKKGFHQNIVLKKKTLYSCLISMFSVFFHYLFHLWIHVSKVSTSSFMKRYADISRTQTQSSFNPLIDDYSNMKFYLSRPIWNINNLEKNISCRVFIYL